jgi:hypothetical protein
MKDFDDWYEQTDWILGKFDWSFRGCMERAYNAGVQSRQTELQNWITELEEIISGREDSKTQTLVSDENLRERGH